MVLIRIKHKHYLREKVGTFCFCHERHPIPHRQKKENGYHLYIQLSTHCCFRVSVMLSYGLCGVFVMEHPISSNMRI